MWWIVAAAIAAVAGLVGRIEHRRARARWEAQDKHERQMYS